MNPILQEIEELGTIQAPSGERLPLSSHVGPGSARVLRAAVRTTRPETAVEVGLAFGVSTLHILDEMTDHGGGSLIGMDPAQFDSAWRGAGLHNVARAGFRERYQFHEVASQILLPRLAADGMRVQFAFIDGWHTFDHTLVDFFYIDQMLDVGGIVVLDDVGYPSLRRLTHFLITNRDYAIVDHDPVPGRRSWKQNAKAAIQQLLRPLVRDNFSASSKSLHLQAPVNKSCLVALQKRAHDSRSFDHFVPF